MINESRPQKRLRLITEAKTGQEITYKSHTIKLSVVGTGYVVNGVYTPFDIELIFDMIDQINLTREKRINPDRRSKRRRWKNIRGGIIVTSVETPKKRKKP